MLVPFDSFVTDDIRSPLGPELLDIDGVLTVVIFVEEDFPPKEELIGRKSARSSEASFVPAN
jgi:hypothetical protein